MKGLSVLAAGVLMMSAAILAQSANAATAQPPCHSSCSAAVAACGTHARCSSDFPNCVRTGTIHFPNGRTFTNLCRK